MAEEDRKPVDPQAVLEILAASGVLGNSPTLDAIARMHQQRMMAQGIQPQYPDLGQSLVPGATRRVERIK